MNALGKEINSRGSITTTIAQQRFIAEQERTGAAITLIRNFFSLREHTHNAGLLFACGTKGGRDLPGTLRATIDAELAEWREFLAR